MDKIIIVAIDGPAGAGKSTIARSVAERLGFLYIDTGAMYRAIALWALRTGTSLDDMHRLEALAVSADLKLVGPGKIELNGEDVSEAIRANEVSQAASKVAQMPGVRRALVEKQQHYGETTSVVMEGRDIGTVVFPEAQVKFYLDANPRIRADRRAAELAERGEDWVIEDLVREIEERDRRDSARAHSPLRQAEDAVYLDTSDLSPAEVEEAILRVVRARTSNGKSLTRQHVE